MFEDKLFIWKVNRGDPSVLQGIYEKYKDDLVTLFLYPLSNLLTGSGLQGL